MLSVKKGSRTQAEKRGSGSLCLLRPDPNPEQLILKNESFALKSEHSSPAASDKIKE
jgi:hypothetical protein